MTSLSQPGIDLHFLGRPDRSPLIPCPSVFSAPSLRNVQGLKTVREITRRSEGPFRSKIEDTFSVFKWFELELVEGTWTPLL